MTAADRARPAARSAPDRLLLDRPMVSLHLILVSGGLLLGIGLVMVLSASMVQSYVDFGSAYGVFKKQLMWVVIGLPVFWLGLRLPPRAYHALAYPALLGCALALAVVLVPGLGVLAHGSRRWLDIGPLQLQPSEPAKLAFLLWGAAVLVRRDRALRAWKHLLVPVAPVACLLAGLIMLEPDLGTTLCFVLILFGLLWTVGAPFRLFGTLLAGAFGAVVLLILVEPYRMARMTSFLHPFADSGNSGYQAVQGLYGLASGGWLGVGLGQSRQKWGLLPNAHTDYIFAIIGEELGLVGCLVVLALFATLAYAGMRVARRSADPFCRLVAGACTVWLVGQAVINMGYVTGLLPVTGIPLPLISAGGTSLVVTLLALGMLASFARHEPAAVAHLAARGPSRLARWLRLPTPKPYLPRRRPGQHPPTRPPGQRPGTRSAPGAAAGRSAPPRVRQQVQPAPARRPQPAGTTVPVRSTARPDRTGPAPRLRATGTDGRPRQR